MEASPDPSARIAELRCSRARRTVGALGELGVDAAGRWSAVCQSAKDGRWAPADVSSTRLERAMKTCPCHGEEVGAIVTRLRRDCALERRQDWARRCTIPGLPGGCM